jgi:hypothetical protein
MKIIHTSKEIHIHIQEIHTCSDFSFSIMSFSIIPKCAPHASSNVRSFVGAGTLLVTIKKFMWVFKNSTLEISGQNDRKP